MGRARRSLLPHPHALFFLISGCFAASAIARPWATVFRSRVVRYLYLYLLWTLIHMATMWAFPDFPTLIPRSLAAFVEAVTISPPSSWYLYALALYFLVAKGLRRLPRWLLLGGAAALAVTVAAGGVDIVSNRGSLLANLLFIGVTFAPRIRRLAGHPRPLVVAVLALGYVAVFGATWATASAAVPGVWLAVSLIGVGAGLAAAPLLPKIPMLGRGLAWLGRRTLPIYVIHMPVLAVTDAIVAGVVSDAGFATQLVAAVLLPVALTAVVVAVSAALGTLIRRTGASWLLDLPTRR